MAKEKTFQAIGRRKAAVARVILKPGKAPMSINGRDLMAYFKRECLLLEIEKPLKVTDRAEAYNIWARIDGGGMAGQARALCLGISRALALAEPELKPALRKEGLLTRDARIVERKKYGKHGARRSTQFSKR